MFQISFSGWRPCHGQGHRIAHWRFRMTARLKRLRRAWLYATGRLSIDAAQSLICDCEPIAGWYPLLVLTAEDTLSEAHDIFADHPDLPRLIDEGCAYVRSKWESCGDDLYEARCWAIERAQDNAARAGVALVKHGPNGDESGATS